MDFVKVSVIVPVYNCETSLEKCVKSIINQTLKDLEIILVDDGSTDNSGKICDELLRDDIRVKVIHQENRGVAEARNAGLARSNGKYIGFVDSDDWIEYNMFETMYNCAELNDLDIVRCNTVIHENGKKIISWCPADIDEVCDEKKIKSEIIPMLIAPAHEAEYTKRLLKGCWCCIFNRSLIYKHGIKFYDIRSGEDALFVMESMWSASRLKLIPEAFYHYVKEKNESLSISLTRYRNYTDRDYTRNIIRNLVVDTEYYPIYQARWEQADRRYIFLDARLATVYNNAKRHEKIEMLRELLDSKEAISAFSKPIHEKLPLQLSILYFLIKKRMHRMLYCAIVLKYR